MLFYGFDLIHTLNTSLQPYANIAAVIGAVFSIASLTGVVFVRLAVDAAVKRQTTLLTCLRASSECRHLAVLLSGIRMLAAIPDWNGVSLRCYDARRVATELSILTDEIESQPALLAGVITQLRTLERSVTASLKKGLPPDGLRVMRTVSNQEDTIAIISGHLERKMREYDAR